MRWVREAQGRDSSGGRVVDLSERRRGVREAGEADDRPIRSVRRLALVRDRIDLFHIGQIYSVSIISQMKQHVIVINDLRGGVDGEVFHFLEPFTLRRGLTIRVVQHEASTTPCHNES